VHVHVHVRVCARAVVACVARLIDLL
jgi:hypothetical protein